MLESLRDAADTANSLILSGIFFQRYDTVEHNLGISAIDRVHSLRKRVSVGPLIFAQQVVELTK